MPNPPAVKIDAASGAVLRAQEGTNFHTFNPLKDFETSQDFKKDLLRTTGV
jgi:hypothetical protein